MIRNMLLITLVMLTTYQRCSAMEPATQPVVKQALEYEIVMPRQSILWKLFTDRGCYNFVFNSGIVGLLGGETIPVSALATIKHNTFVIYEHFLKRLPQWQLGFFAGELLLASHVFDQVIDEIVKDSPELQVQIKAHKEAFKTEKQLPEGSTY